MTTMSRTAEPDSVRSLPAIPREGEVEWGTARLCQNVLAHQLGLRDCCTAVKAMSGSISTSGSVSTITALKNRMDLSKTAAETDYLVAHLQTLLDAGNTVVAAELDMRVTAVADHVIGREPGAADASRTAVAAGTPAHIAEKGVGTSAGYLTAALQAAATATPS